MSDQEDAPKKRGRGRPPGPGVPIKLKGPAYAKAWRQRKKEEREKAAAERKENPPPLPHEHRPTDADRAKVRTMATLGVPKTMIAEVMGLAFNTLRKHYERELAVGSAEGAATLAKTAYYLAVGMGADGRPDPARADKSMLTFLCKTRLGYKVTERIEHTGADGGPISFSNLENLSNKQLADLLDIYKALGVDVPDGVMDDMIDTAPAGNA